MTDRLTPEMQAMLRINNARKLATEPDRKPRQVRMPGNRVRRIPSDMPPQPLTAPQTSVSPPEVVEYHEIPGEAVRLPRGVLRRQQIHNIMAGNWQVLGEVRSPDGTRSLTTSCGYKAKRVFTLKDRDTGRVISAAIGEIRAHTNLVLAKDDKEARKLSVASAFA